LRRGISRDTSSCSFDLGGDSVGCVKVSVSACIGFVVSLVLPHGKKVRAERRIFLMEEKYDLVVK